MSESNVRLQISEDYLAAYFIVEAETEENVKPLDMDKLLAKLEKAKVSWGIDKSTLRAMCEYPVAGAEVLIAQGMSPVNGENGRIEYFVKPSSEYKPDFGGDSDDIVDYKNVDVFQLVEKGRELCRIIPPGKGKDGVNIFGGVVPARDGKEANSPRGANTEFSPDGLTLLASVPGSVSFKGEVVSVVDMLNIEGDVNLATGNVRFEGDILVRGSINEGFTVICGGSLTVKGKIGNAEVKVKGNLIVGEGINGARRSRIEVGGFVKSKFIESSILRAEGDIISDYIIDSVVEGGGNIVLTGKKSRLVGGKTTVMGELSANFIGNEREIRTRLELAENPQDKEVLAKTIKARDKAREDLKAHKENIARLRAMAATGDKPEIEKLLRQLTTKLPGMIENANVLEHEAKKLKETELENYPGRITCRRIIYLGVDIYAGSMMFQRDHSNLEHCKLYLNNGNWVKGLA